MSIQCLPQELVIYVATFLSVPEVLRLAGTSRSLRKHLKDEQLWEIMFRQRFQFKSFFGKPLGGFRHLFRQTALGSIRLQGLERCKELEKAIANIGVRTLQCAANGLSVVLSYNGSVYLGNTSDSQAGLVKMDHLSDIKAVDCSSDVILALTNESKVVGISPVTSASAQVVQFDNIGSDIPVDVSCFHHLYAVLTKCGRVWMWGSGEYGELGLGTPSSRVHPSLLPSLTNITHISCGAAFAVACSGEGRTYSWGCGHHGRLGHPTLAHSHRPKRIEALGGQRVVFVSCGKRHALALTDRGRVFSWGTVCEGASRRFPALEEGIRERVVKIAAGPSHAMVVTASGRIFGWGSNHQSQLWDRPHSTLRRVGLWLPQRDVDFTETPTLLQQLNDDVDVIVLSCGRSHSAIYSGPKVTAVIEAAPRFTRPAVAAILLVCASLLLVLALFRCSTTVFHLPHLPLLVV